MSTFNQLPREHQVAFCAWLGNVDAQLAARLQSLDMERARLVEQRKQLARHLTEARTLPAVTATVSTEKKPKTPAKKPRRPK